MIRYIKEKLQVQGDWDDFLTNLKRQTNDIQNVLKDAYYREQGLNDVFHKRSQCVILWNKNNKPGDPDDGRLELVLKALREAGVTGIVIMGDQFASNRTNYNSGNTRIQTSNAGEVTITVNGQDFTVVDFTRRAGITDFEKDNLLVQWYAMKYVADNCSLRAIACAARTGGSHGPYFLGLPLVYVDNNLGSANSFMQERMSLQCLFDDYITAIPNLKGTGATNIEACKTWVIENVQENIARFIPGNANFREKPCDIAL